VPDAGANDTFHFLSFPFLFSEDTQRHSSKDTAHQSVIQCIISQWKERERCSLKDIVVLVKVLLLCVLVDVAVIPDGGLEPRGQDIGLEVVLSSEVVEADDLVDHRALVDDEDGWQDSDAQTLCQERALLCVDLHKPRLNVLLAQFSQVLVNNLTPPRRRSEQPKTQA